MKRGWAWGLGDRASGFGLRALAPARLLPFRENIGTHSNWFGSRCFAFVLTIALAASGARAADGTARELLVRAGEQLEAWDIDGAAAVLHEMEQRAPSAPETKWVRGRVAFESGDYDAAVKDLEAARSEGLQVAGLDEDLRVAENAGEEIRGAEPIESAHFIFRAKAAKDRLLAPYALDALEKAWAALTSDLAYTPGFKMRVEVYDTPEALARVSPLTVAEIKGSGTIALCKYNRLMVTSPRALLRGYPWVDTVTHEFVHFLVTHKGRNSVPIWLQEGLAKFLETRWRGEPGKAIDAMQAELLLKAAKKKELIPFAAMHPSIAKLPTQEKAALAFAEVEAAIRLLYQRGGSQALAELIDAMAHGFSDEKAVAQAYGKPFEQFEADWRAEVARPRPARDEEGKQGPARKLVFKEDAKGQPERPDGEPVAEPVDPRAKKSVKLAEIFFVRGRLDAAALEYEKAREQMDKPDPTLLRRLGYSLLNGKQHTPQDAIEPLQQAVKLDREDSGAQLLLAGALFATGQFKAAYAPLQAAVEVDPFDPRVHVVWEKAAKAAGDPAVAERERAASNMLLASLPPEGGSGQSASPSSASDPGRAADPARASSKEGAK